MQGGNGKWSQLFPFPQPVYGNIMGARLSSHGGGKDSGRESERQEKVKGGRRGWGGRGAAEMLLLAVLPAKDLALCVSFIVYSSLWQRPIKPPFIYPEHLALLRKGPERRAAMTCAMVTRLPPC